MSLNSRQMESSIEHSSFFCSSFCRASLRRRAAFLAFIFLASFTGLGQKNAYANDALKFFKNYFVTGNYVVGGIGLRSQGVTDLATQAVTGGVSTYATGTIHVNGVPGYVSATGVPQHADIVAAYLYWETVATAGADPALLAKGTFRGLKIVGTQVAPAGTASCGGSGGGNGNQSTAQVLLVYRADVLRYLPYAHDASGKPTGQRLVNDIDLTANGFAPHIVSLPDSGASGSTSPSTGNQAFVTEGASLVVVYRIAGANPVPPLTSVVLYDGGYTYSSVNPLMTQTIQGFYEASKVGPVAQMTHIVGDGRSNFKEQLTVNGSVPTGVSSTNPFSGAQGSAWDNLTFSVGNLMTGDDASTFTEVTPGNPSSTACLSWGAIVFSTSVQAPDGDGLLSKWKTSVLTDPNGKQLPNLMAMGAKVGQKDVFVQIDYMNTPGYSNNTQGQVPAHSHLPAQAVLDQVGSTLLAHGTHIHFDVGNNYQGDPYVIPMNYAVGGHAITETSCGATQTPACMYPDFPGTVSWKPGFKALAEQYFDPDNTRKDMVHEAIFAHALGLPRWRINDKTLTSIVVANGTATATVEVPHGLNGAATVTVVGAPVASGLNGTYAANANSSTTITFSTAAASGAYQNWGLALSDGTPRSNSGVSDVGGGDLMVTLGRWDNFTGSTFMQASTFLHELGHNLDLGHGGDISDFVSCKSNYQSTMSYLFQVRGLLDINGVPHIDYSNVALPALNEGNLNESPSGLGAGNLSYLPRWYAPASTSFLDKIVNTSPATKHCNGTPITDGAQMVRVDGTTLAASPLDWNGDGNTTEAGLIQDINFDGSTTDPLFQGFNDWANLNLQQVGARRGASGDSANVGPGQDTGDDQGIAGGDLGIAGGDLGIAGGDLGIAGGDLGIAGGDLGIAGGDLGIAGGDLGGELDVDLAKALGNAPNALAATVVGFNIDLTWMPPNVGSVTQYQVWRATCPHGTTPASCSLSPSTTPVQIGSATPGGPLCDTSYLFCDTSTKPNALYIYFVTATVTAKQSGASNLAYKER